MSSFNIKPYTTAGTSQLTVNPPIFGFWQYKDTFIGNKVYANNASTAPITATTATFSVLQSNQFTGGETVYDPNNTAGRPYVGKQVGYTRFTTTSANGSVKIPVAWDMSSNTHGVATLRVVTPSAPGKVKFRTSAGNELVKPFAGLTTVGTTFNVLADLNDATLATGTFNKAVITEVEISLDTTGHTIEWAMSYGVDDELQTIGSYLYIDHGCVSSAAKEMNLETSDLLCGQLVERKIATGRSVSQNLATKVTDLLRIAIATGTMPANSPALTKIAINSDVVGKKAITADKINVGTAVAYNIASVTVGGKPYFQTPTNTATGIAGQAFHYNSTTGDITFPTGLNGNIPTVYVYQNETITNFDIKGLELGYIGMLLVPRATQQGATIFERGYKAQLMSSVENADDAGDETELQYAILPDGNKRFMNVAISG